jgi:hypothetical protein
MSTYQYTEPFDPDDYLNWYSEQERLAKETPLGIDDLIPPAALADPPVELNLSEAQGIPLDPVLLHGWLYAGITPATPTRDLDTRFRIRLDPHAYLALQALPSRGSLLHETQLLSDACRWEGFFPGVQPLPPPPPQQTREQEEAQKMAAFCKRLEEEKERVRQQEMWILYFQPSGQPN